MSTTISKLIGGEVKGTRLTVKEVDLLVTDFPDNEVCLRLIIPAAGGEVQHGVECFINRDVLLKALGRSK